MVVWREHIEQGRHARWLFVDVYVPPPQAAAVELVRALRCAPEEEAAMIQGIREDALTRLMEEQH